MARRMTRRMTGGGRTRLARAIRPLALAAVGVLTMSGQAKDLFVSANPAWKMPGKEGETYADLQAALEKVAAGDTVWVEDGFVCDSGETDQIGGFGRARVRLPNVTFTLRSAAGLVDEAKGKGAYIRGAKDPDSAHEDGRGANAVRPVWARNGLPVLQGLVLEGGVTGDSAVYGVGGAVYGAAIVTNCLIRNCTAYAGGGLSSSSCRAYGTVISNCCAFGVGYGGGAVYGGASLYGCLLSGNWAAKLGGAIYYNNNGTDCQTTYSNCTVRGNWALSFGGAAYPKDVHRVTFVDCKILGNRAMDGAVGGVGGKALFRRCLIAGNESRIVATAYRQARCGGVGSSPNAAAGNLAVLVDCTVSSNFTHGTGGGLDLGIATNCLFLGNVANNNGGGAYRAELEGCRLIGNSVSNVVSANNAESGNGGGCANSTARNCLIAGNSSWAQNLISSGNGGGAAHSDLSNCVVSNNWAGYRGAAVFNPGGDGAPRVCCNCLIVANRSAAPKVGYDRGMIIEGEWANVMPANPPEFYNCTVVGNVTPAYGVINAAKLVNCVVWDNSCPNPKDELYPKQVTARHTVQKDLADGVDGNRSGNPNLGPDYRPLRRRPCVDAGEAYAWMTAEGDARAFDLDGHARVLGSAPDIGCYERQPAGLTLLLR